MRNCFLFVAIAVTFSGCDLGTYSSRYKEVAGSSTGTSTELADSVAISGETKVRLPTVLADEYAKRFDPNSDFVKARIPQLDFPGFKASFVGDKQSDGGSWFPVQAYFYVTPIDGKNIVDFKKELRDLIVKKNSSFEDRWEEMSVEAFDGSERAWSRLELIGTQQFLLIDGNGIEKRENLIGKMNLMLTSNDSSFLVVAFRAPAEIDTSEMQSATVRSLQGFH